MRAFLLVKSVMSGCHESLSVGYSLSCQVVMKAFLLVTVMIDYALPTGQVRPQGTPEE